MTRCPKCGKYLNKSETVCVCSAPDKSTLTFEQVSDMPVTNVAGCKELLNAVILSASECYVRDMLRGLKPMDEDVNFLPSGIKEHLDEYVSKFKPLVDAVRNSNIYAETKTKCPACGGNVSIVHRKDFVRVWCTSCICKYSYKS